MSRGEAKKGMTVLRPRARLIRTIGRDLISNEIVALTELIKNAYDADAKEVSVTFLEPLRPGDGEIVVSDDGIGMSLEHIKEAWFEPATVSKLRKRQTSSGRRVTGEKGIGRFAAARLARFMEMTSVAKGSRKLVQVRFDWGAFEDEALYLDQVRSRWEETAAPRERKHGTTLRLVGLNDEWTSESFSRLRGELSRLISPLGTSDFKIELVLPEKFKEYSGPVTPPSVLGKPHYRLAGKINDKGLFEATYQGPDTEQPVKVPGKVQLERGRVPSSGPFSFEFRVWDRETEDLDPLARELGSTVRQLRQDLNAASGISIYRDNFRVLLADNDWLRLDLRRVQNPTLRLSNNQIVGAVFISADKNRGLRDQSNREGIVSSLAFDDFKATMIELLSELEVKRDNHRRGDKRRDKTSALFEKLNIDPLKDYLVERYPDDRELRSYLDNRTRLFQQGIQEVQQVLARYRRLATLGQLIDVVLHEGRTPIAAISNEAELAIRELDSSGKDLVSAEEMRQRLRVVIQQAEVLSGLFRRLAPFGGRKRGKPAELAIEKIIANTFELYKLRIQELGVSLTLPTGNTIVTVDESEMQQIFVNLLDNSLYWLEKVRASERKIMVQVSRSLDELVILFSNSGPGVPEDVQDRIFDPYFSTKPDGVGLGLTIAGETAAEYDGALELLDRGPLPGATFRIVLRKRIG